jgi:hypothetical protein
MPRSRRLSSKARLDRRIADSILCALLVRKRSRCGRPIFGIPSGHRLTPVLVENLDAPAEQLAFEVETVLALW